MDHSDFKEGYAKGFIDVRLNSKAFIDFDRSPLWVATVDPLKEKAIKLAGLAIALASFGVLVSSPFCGLLFGAAKHSILSIACSALFGLFAGLIAIFKGAEITSRRWIAEDCVDDPDTFTSLLSSGFITLKIKR